MARTPGRKGRLYLAATGSGEAVPVAATKSFQVDAQTPFYESTAQGDTSQQFGAGLPGGSGSFEGFYDPSSYSGAVFTAARDGQSRKMYAYPDASDNTKYWFTTANVSASFTAPVDGMETVSATWSAASDLIPVGVS